MPPKKPKRPGYWKTIESRDADADVLVGIARCCHDDVGDLVAAKAALARAIELEPIHFEAHEVLSSLLRGEGDLDGAAALLQGVVERMPLDQVGRRLFLAKLSGVHMARRDWRAALDALDALQGLRDDGELYHDEGIRKGRAHMELGELPQAVAALREVDARYDVDDVLPPLAAALHLCGEWAEAEEVYWRCVDRGMHPCWAQTRLAMALVERGDYESAQRHAKAARGLDRPPGIAPVAIVEGDLLRCCDGDLAGARAKYEQAIAEEANPKAVVLAHAGLGFVALAEGDAARARELFELAKASGEHEPVVLLGLGQALAATGQEAGARASLEHALELRPGWAEAQAAVEALGSSSAAGASAGASSDERPAKRSRRRR